MSIRLFHYFNASEVIDCMESRLTNQKVCEIITNIINENSEPPTDIKVQHQSAYSLLSFYDSGSLRVKYGSKISYISLAEPFKSLLSNYPDLTIQQLESEKLWTRVLFKSVDDLIKLSPLFVQVYDAAYLLVDTEIFSCCSRYVECSDNMKCVHPNLKFSKGCMYRKNLSKGLIFYGKNVRISS